MDVPEYVNSEAPLEKSASAIYADPINNEYPMDTKEKIWLGYAYLRTKQASTQQSNVTNQLISDNLEYAAAALNIHEDLEKIDAHFNSIEKQANTKEYAVQFEDNDSIKSYYPLNNPQEITKSAEAIVKDRAKLPLSVFVSACENVVKAAKNQNVDTTFFADSVLEYGITKKANFQTAALVAEQRAREIDDEKVGDLYRGLVKFAKEDSDNIDEYIGLFRELDDAYGVNYDVYGVVDPYKAFYSGIEEDEFE